MLGLLVLICFITVEDNVRTFQGSLANKYKWRAKLLLIYSSYIDQRLCLGLCFLDTHYDYYICMILEKVTTFEEDFNTQSDNTHA